MTSLGASTPVGLCEQHALPLYGPKAGAYQVTAPIGPATAANEELFVKVSRAQ